MRRPWPCKEACMMEMKVADGMPLYIADAEVERILRAGDLAPVLTRAFLSWREGQVNMQPRFRTDQDGFRLVSMGAVMPALGYAGVKVYSHVAGRLCFRIMLFCTRTGAMLATVEANALTKFRTAACSVLSARRYADPQADTLGLFGLGPVGYEHALQLSRAFPLRRILLCDPRAGETLRAALERDTGVRVALADADAVARQSNIIVTATRSLVPVFDGALLRPGTFVAAVGSCLKHAREVDAVTVARAGVVVLEWPEQTLQDTGDLLLFDDQAALRAKVESLADMLAAGQASAYEPGRIVMYNAVGVALEDIAAASMIYETALEAA
ncbi:hypothetical protein NJI34_42510 [Pseudomonas sp. S 311-6]|nr:hypothetical protein [Pseudomonas sp. S 311-6]